MGAPKGTRRVLQRPHRIKPASSILPPRPLFISDFRENGAGAACSRRGRDPGPPCPLSLEGRFDGRLSRWLMPAYPGYNRASNCGKRKCGGVGGGGVGGDRGLPRALKNRWAGGSL